MISLHAPVYFLFLAGVALLYWLAARLSAPNKARLWLLLVASYLFYAWMDPRYALVLGAVTLVNYGILAWSARRRDLGAPVWAGVAFNLLVLALFKYSNFFLPVGSSLFTPGGPLAWTAWAPVGISFYLFQAIALLVEVKAGRQPLPGLLETALYLAFFPRLIAGPIVLPRQFFKQTAALPARLDSRRLREGLALLIFGLFKKVVIADSLGSISAVAFRAAGLPGAFPTPLYIQGFYLYAFQIYADFAGYTDLARGSALLLGFELPANFNRPYLAASLGDFWNRWHMSLTQWFREYLFYPLSRRMLQWTRRRYSQAVQAAANLTTMLLIGLWHGAAWTFVAWGAYHGLLLTLERWWPAPKAGRWGRFLRGALTFHVVGVGWVLFASGSFGETLRYLAGLVSLRWTANLPGLAAPVILAGALLFGLDWLQQAGAGAPSRPLAAARRIFLATAVILAVFLQVIAAVRGGMPSQFIYGRF